MNRILYLATIIIIVLCCIAAAQTDITYEATFQNDQIISSNQYEFDIFIKQTGGSDTFRVFGLQVALLVNDSIRNDETLSLSYIVGTSQMAPNQIPSDLSIGASALGWQIIKIPALYEVNSYQSTIISKGGNGTRFGRYRLSTNSASFANYSPNIKWAFNSVVFGYQTTFYAWINNMIKDITDSTKHYSFLQNSPLPIELNSFTISTNDRNVILNWETKSESNTALFEIERQKILQNQVDNWIKIGHVNASGNSNSPKYYKYSDLKLNTGTYKYRLKMIDNDGSFIYSDIVETQIELPKEYSLSQNYPNPFNPVTKIDYQLPFDSKVKLELYDIIGECVAVIVNEELNAGYYTTLIDATAFKLASGIYFYKLLAKNLSNVKAEEYVQIKKLVLMK